MIFVKTIDDSATLGASNPIHALSDTIAGGVCESMLGSLMP